MSIIPETGNSNDFIARAWREHATDLARWSLPRLFVRRDLWGGYRSLADVGREYTKPDGTTGALGSQTTRPALSRRGQVLLTEEVLQRHFEGRRREDLVGAHSTSPENKSL